MQVCNSGTCQYCLSCIMGYEQGGYLLISIIRVVGCLKFFYQILYTCLISVMPLYKGRGDPSS